MTTTPTKKQLGEAMRRMRENPLTKKQRRHLIAEATVRDIEYEMEPPDPDNATPGSPLAIHRGCICARDDNASRKGAWGTSGPDALFWITEGCPVHGDAMGESSEYFEATIAG